MGQNINKIFKSGNSLVIAVPKIILKAQNLKKGDLVRIDKLTKVQIQEVKEKSEQKKL